MPRKQPKEIAKKKKEEDKKKKKEEAWHLCVPAPSQNHRWSIDHSPWKMAPKTGQDRLEAPQVLLTLSRLFLPWHLPAFPAGKVISQPLIFLLSIKSPSKKCPFTTSSQICGEGTERPQAHSLASTSSFWLSVKCLCILSLLLNCTGTVTSLCLVSPQQTAEAIETFLVTEGREERRKEGERIEGNRTQRQGPNSLFDGTCEKCLFNLWCCWHKNKLGGDLCDQGWAGTTNTLVPSHLPVFWGLGVFLFLFCFGFFFFFFFFFGRRQVEIPGQGSK